MSDATNAEDEFRTAYKTLIDQVGEDAALQMLDDLRSDAHASATFGEPLFEDDGSEGSEEYEYDEEERRQVEANNEDVLVDEDGNHVRQSLHGEVRVTAIEDGQLVLDGDTYDAKGHIKAVDYQSRTFDGDRKVWLVDEDRIEELHRNLNGGGYLFKDGREESEAVCVDCGQEIPEGMFDHCSSCPTPQERLGAFIAEVSEGDRICVEYEQKNGEKMNEKEGIVRETRLPEEEEFTDVPTLRFERDDGQRMYIKPDTEYEKTLALYTAMSHAPFVGDVEDMTVVEDDE